LLIATALIAAAGPAAAQDNTAANAAATTADPLATPDANATMTDPALANGMAMDPALAGTTADPMATDPALAVPVEEDDDDGFPWGLLGLLGLAGLIPRKRRDERDTTVNRTDNR
jgi:MYXO-CTERM domain-containing protein